MVPCGTHSSSISPFLYFSLNTHECDARGKEQIILRTRPAWMSAARPVSKLPALLLTTVKSRAPWSISAWINSVGAPAPPNPPMRMVAPSWMPAKASARPGTYLLFILLLSCVFVDGDVYYLIVYNVL